MLNIIKQCFNPQKETNSINHTIVIYNHYNTQPEKVQINQSCIIPQMVVGPNKINIQQLKFNVKNAQLYYIKNDQYNVVQCLHTRKNKYSNCYCVFLL